MVNYALPAGVTKAEADAAPGYSWSKADQRTNNEFEGPQPCIRCCYSLAKGRDCSGHSLTGCTQCVRGKHGACVPVSLQAIELVPLLTMCLAPSLVRRPI